MKTNTKIFATFGIVAGLGIASLPVFSYATDVSGDIQIDAEITPAIAMRIHSNADVNCTDTQDPSTCADTYGVIKYNPATTQSTGEPNSVDGPSLATGLELSANQKDLTTLYSDVEVRSNTGKFQLTLADNDTDTRLNLSSASTEQNQYIETAGGEPEAGSASWAVRGGDIDEWSAMPASDAAPLTILNNGINATSPLDFSSVATVNYGVSSGQSKTGTYSDVVTYTATANDDNPYVGNMEIPEVSGLSISPRTLTIPEGESKTITVTPDPGNYLSEVICPTGYTCTGYTTDKSNTASAMTQTITITNQSAGYGIFASLELKVEKLIGGGYMQDFSASNHASDAAGTTYTVVDSRDGQEYQARKLTDGNIWMTQNLRLVGPKTLTSADSDVSSSFDLPATSSYFRSSCADSAAHSSVHRVASYGSHYNWYAATAGTGTCSMNSNERATSSICPKGWRLPTDIEFQTLYENYNSASALRDTTYGPALVLSGYRYDQDAALQGSSGLYWSSVANSNNSARNLYLYSFDVLPPPSNYNKGFGLTVRCLAAS
ncbi:hypothetical protein IJJ18_03455 [Candidatus Saccharibacteria bacterium]|nr:hypothetical protein [Candidatus Saccharibacteria bacterium]